VSQPALGAELLSQAFDSALAEPPSADPRKEPISVETTDTSITAENMSLSLTFNFPIYSVFHSLFDYSSCQILSKETPVQEQELGSSPTNNDLADARNNSVVDTHIADSLIRHTLDGEETICFVHFSAASIN